MGSLPTQKCENRNSEPPRYPKKVIQIRPWSYKKRQNREKSYLDRISKVPLAVRISRNVKLTTVYRQDLASTATTANASENRMSAIRNNQNGAALLGAVIALVVLMSIAAVMAVNTASDTRLRGAFGHTIEGFYAAESGLNIGMARFKNIFLDYNVPTSADFVEQTVAVGDRQVTYSLNERPGNPRSVVIPAGEVFAGVNSQQFSYVVSSQASNGINDTEARVGAEFLVSYIPLFQFVAFYRDDLEILPGPDMFLTGRVHTNGNLYLNANSELHVEDAPAEGVNTVQVSAGENIYRGRKDGNTCGGTVVIDKLEDVVAPAGDLDPRNLDCSGGATRLVPQSELDAWQGSIKSQIETITIPEPDIIDRGTGIFWNKADLRIVLKLNAPDNLPAGPQLAHSLEVQHASGARDIPLTNRLHQFMRDNAWNAASSTYVDTMPVFYTDVPVAGPLCTCDDATPLCNNAAPTCYDDLIPDITTGSVRPGGVYGSVMGQPDNFDLDYRRGGYYNWREQKWMLLLNINIGDLIRWNDERGEPFFATADATHGGIVIYATVEGPASAGVNNYGVRLFGGANLAIPGGIDVVANPTGLTVVSDQAMYVLGDYNRGLVDPATLQPWADQAILPRQPAAIIGDSINVMSEGYWRPDPFCAVINPLCRDGQSVVPLTSGPRDGFTTVINAAFLGGVDTTPEGFVGTYNGGMENYPRFHETWSGQWLRYRGSFVSLGEPEHVQGLWCGTGDTCNIYNPPKRDWNFDTAFNDVANLPPLTPRFTFLKQRVFAQEFK